MKGRFRKQAAPVSSSPPDAAPGRLLIGGAATAAKNGGGGELGFRRSVAQEKAAARVRVAVPRGAARLK
jgi:hypothetical protein